LRRASVEAIAVQAEDFGELAAALHDPERMQVLQVFCKPSQRIGGLA